MQPLKQPAPVRQAEGLLSSLEKFAGWPSAPRKLPAEITEMVGSIQSGTNAAVQSMDSGKLEVARGVATTAQAGESLARIISTVDNVGRMVSQIAAATTEQAAAAEEVSLSIQRISSLVDESAHAANETDHACRGLNELSSTLQHSIAQFHI